MGALRELVGLSSTSDDSAWDLLLTAAVRVAQRGAPVAWRKVCGDQHGRVVSLPTYPFARERHWIGEHHLPTDHDVDDSGQPVEQATPLERQLHALWAKVLGHSHFDLTDNFFMVGGHSLLAVRLISRIKENLDVELTVSSISQAPTISQLAKVMRDEKEVNHWYSLVPIQPGGGQGHLCLRFTF